MPVIKLQNREITIPFNPQAIGRLMYEGYEVWPDPDTPQDRAKAEGYLIQEELRRLWKDQPLRTVPGRDEKAGKDYGWEEDWNWLTDMNKRVGPSDYMKVLPNPGTSYRTPILQNNPPGLLEAKGEGIFYSLLKGLIESEKT